MMSSFACYILRTAAFSITLYNCGTAMLFSVAVLCINKYWLQSGLVFLCSLFAFFILNMHMEDSEKGGKYMTVLLSVRNIKKEFMEKNILRGISFDISIGEKIGLVGLNGAGKTTVVNIIEGSLPYDEGSVLWHKKSVNIGYLKQDSAYIKSINCEENLKSFLQVSSNLGLKKVHQWNEEKFNNLSGGERTKIALSEIWSTNPEFLILDEPTNHLDYDGIQWIIKEIKRYKGTAIVISHDRYFLDECVDKIMEIDEGSICEYNGNYSFYRKEKRRRYESKLNQYLIQEETKRKINEQITTLKNWSAKAHREAPKKAAAAGNKKGGKEFLRVKAKKMDIQIKSRIKRLEKIKIEGVEKPKEEKKIDFNIQKGKLKGTRILEAINISKSFEGKVLFTESSFYIKRGEKAGIIGSNGCGKTTLIKILLREESPEKGKVFLSTSIKTGYLSQDLTEIHKEKAALDIFSINSREERGKLMTVLFNMGFDERMLTQPLKTLSLGEITRLRIAKIIQEDCDLLILDEPLNHLDIYSREKLEEVLEDYEGTIIVVSHDRYMLQRICNKLLVFENKKIKRVEHTLKEYLEIDNNKMSSIYKNKLEEKMIIENEMIFILGELNKYPKESYKYKELDMKYESLISRKKELSQDGSYL